MAELNQRHLNQRPGEAELIARIQSFELASHGELDEIGLRAVIGRTTVHDLHATMLHLLGIDHEQLTYFHNIRQRLTDVAGEVLHKILA